MPEFLLDNGAKMAAIFEGKTALEEVFDSLGSSSNMKKRDQFHMLKVIYAFSRVHGFQMAYSCTPLHIAPMDLVIHLLLKYKGDINVRDMDGRTPLNIAIGRQV